MPDPMQPITSVQLQAMGPAEVLAFWKARQTARRDAGLSHYARLVDPTTDRVVASIGDEG